MLGWGVLEGRVPPLWEIRPTEFPLAGEVLDRATGVIVHSRYVEARAREHGYDGPLWRIPHPAWPAPDVEPARGRRRAALRLLRAPEREQAHPAAAARVRRAPRARIPARGCCSSAPRRRASTSPAGSSGSASTPTGVIREPYVEEERLWALMAACDACVLLRAPTMGETSGSAIRTLSLGKPLVVSDLGWFAELPDDVALKVPVGGDEEIAALVAALERLAEPGVARAHGRGGARVRPGASTTSSASPSSTRPRSSRRPAAPAVEAKILRAVAEAAADTRRRRRRRSRRSSRSSASSARTARAPVSDTTDAGSLADLADVGLARRRSTSSRSPCSSRSALRVVSPWIMVDELVYSDMARSFADTGHFLIRGVHANYGFVYPLLLSPAYALFGSMTDVYQWARVRQRARRCARSSFPAYLLARRVVRPGAALAAAALAVAIPPIDLRRHADDGERVLSGLPWLAYALVLALERPTLRRQLVLLALCALAFLTRAQAVALVAAVLTAPLALAWIERGRPRRLGAWKPLYGVVALAARRSSSSSRSRAAARRRRSSAATASRRRTARYHAVAGAPLDRLPRRRARPLALRAAVRGADRARRERAPSRPARCASSAAAAVVARRLARARGRRSSPRTYSHRIEERNLFYVAPLFLIALLAWIERGQPRPPRAAVAAAGVAAALPGAIPFLSLMNINAQSDTPFIQPWWYLGDARRRARQRRARSRSLVVARARARASSGCRGRYAPVLPALVALGFLADLAAAPALDALVPASLAQPRTRPGSAPHARAGSTAPSGATPTSPSLWTGDNPYRGLGERVLEPQRPAASTTSATPLSRAACPRRR